MNAYEYAYLIGSDSDRRWMMRLHMAAALSPLAVPVVWLLCWWLA